MSRSDDALAALEKAAAEVLDCAKSSHGGVGLACFSTEADQSEAFAKARAKEAAAKFLVGAVAAFKDAHGGFK